MKSLDSFDRAVRAPLARSAAFVSAHPRGIAASIALALAGFAATAYGIAHTGPDPADLPRRLVTESVTPEDIATQLEALAEHELQLYRSDLTRSGDTPESLLGRLGVNDPEAAGFLRRDPVARRIVEGRAGKMLRATVGETGALDELVVRYAPADSALLGTQFTRLRIKRDAIGLSASVESAALASQVRLGSGTIRTSQFAATDDARIPDAIANQLAEVFSTDIDFHRELRKDDSFSVVYEALTADGEPITWNTAGGKVLAAEFVNRGKAYSAVWFKDESATKGGYYALDGRSKRRAFLASPMEFSRVTSGFAMRLHPILNQWRQHNGVDYGAPTGTPVRAVGDGTVEFAGWQNGYGNVVQIRHGNDRSTLYAHLSRIDVRKGQAIEQGARVGAVGATGWATGPHLHFEVKVGGAQRNPLAMAQASEAIELSAVAKPRFDQIAQSVRGQLDAAETVSGRFAE